MSPSVSVGADTGHQTVIGTKCERISHCVGLQTADQKGYFTKITQLVRNSQKYVKNT